MIDYGIEQMSEEEMLLEAEKELDAILRKALGWGDYDHE
tara:strand:+ start:7580 stop:7696 length:117 start_codon:yes stop_codon:yes gene_type:complete